MSLPPKDFALLITALRHMFDHLPKKEVTEELEHIKDVHDFLFRVLQDFNAQDK